MVSCVALAITTPVGVVIHTGDFKVDPTPTDNELFDLHTLADYGKRGVLLLLSDSTNSDRPGYSESERAVRPRFEDIFNRAEKRLVFPASAPRSTASSRSSIFRRSSAARSRILGRSMISVTEIAHNHGLLDIPDNILIRPQDIMETRRRKVTLLISGTQGEPMSALSRVAVDNHKHISIEPGDTVVLSSRIIPGNEKAIFRMIDHMSRRGADVLYGSMNPPIHVSGPRQRRGAAAGAESGAAEVLCADPRRVPAAFEAYPPGRAPALRRAWRRRFCSRPATCWNSTARRAQKAGRVTVGRVCIDSGAVDEVVEEMVIRDRRHLSEDGIVLPIIAINRHTGRIETLPEIVSRGFALG